MSNRKKLGLKRPELRRLKIQPKTRYNRWSQKDVPEIKLCGEWLRHLGFLDGQNVIVTTMPNLLIIKPEADDKQVA